MNKDKSPRVRRMQWMSVTLLMLAGIVNYLDRSSLAIANTHISAELQLSATEMGLLLSSFSWVLAISLLPIGGILDRFGTRKVLAIGLLAWSLAQMAGGLIGSLGALIAVRALLAIGESPQYPSGSKVVNEWFPVRERGFPIGLIMASTTLGSMLAPPLQTMLILSFGWRAMFVIMGAIGFPIAIAWYFIYRDRDDNALSAHEMSYLQSGDTRRHDTEQLTLQAWLGVFRQRTTWGMMLGFMGILYMVYLHLAWLPNYLQRERHFSIAQSGWAAAIPYLAGTVGMLCSGAIADMLVRRGMSPINSRKVPLCLGLLSAAAFTVPAALAENAQMALACISGAMFCLNIAGGSVWGLVSVAAPRHLVASLGSIQNFGASVGAAFAPFITGWIVDKTHSFVYALLVSAVVAVFSAGFYLFWVRHPIESAAPDAAIVGA
jgi:sugar phosphate permease